MEIRINRNEIRFIHNDDLNSNLKNLGSAETKRASHVEPNSTGGWKVDLTPVGGPVIDDFERRDVALKYEIDWLIEHKIPIIN